MDWAGKRISHYRVVEQIGKGGMGVVLKAWDETLSRWVAIKALRPRSSEEGGTQPSKRFISEARALAQLNHANIATIHEVIADGPFLVLEFIDGPTFKDLAKAGHLPVPRIVTLVGQAASGLAAAHDRQILHRDVKPSNLVVCGQDKVKVIDFGIAKWADDPEPERSEVGEVLGTLQFIAPEIVRGGTATEQSDIYALGLTMFYMLTGEPPYSGQSVDEVMGEILFRDLELPVDVKRRLPSELVELLKEMTEKDPRDRPSHMEEVARRLASLVIGEAPSDEMSTESVRAPPTPQPANAAPRRRWLPYVLAGWAVLLVGLAVGSRLDADGDISVATDDGAVASVGQAPPPPPVAQAVQPAPNPIEHGEAVEAVEAPIAENPPPLRTRREKKTPDPNQIQTAEPKTEVEQEVVLLAEELETIGRLIGETDRQDRPEALSSQLRELKRLVETAQSRGVRLPMLQHHLGSLETAMSNRNWEPAHQRLRRMIQFLTRKLASR